MKSWIALTMISLAASTAFAQNPDTGNILHLEDPTLRPSASIEDVAWLAGSWEGEGFGGSIEEVWTAPSAGTMVGLFKLMHEGNASMYELELIVEEQGSLVVQVKHFNADMSAWEEKTEFVSFPLVKLEPGAAYFDGLTFRMDGPDRMNVYLSVKTKEGVIEERISYLRAKLPDGGE